jgi:hypothetical protein
LRLRVCTGPGVCARIEDGAPASAPSRDAAGVVVRTSGRGRAAIDSVRRRQWHAKRMAGRTRETNGATIIHPTPYAPGVVGLRSAVQLPPASICRGERAIRLTCQAWRAPLTSPVRCRPACPFEDQDEASLPAGTEAVKSMSSPPDGRTTPAISTLPERASAQRQGYFDPTRAISAASTHWPRRCRQTIFISSRGDHLDNSSSDGAVEAATSGLPASWSRSLVMSSCSGPHGPRTADAG